MTEYESCRKTALLCVAAICLTALLCSWILRSPRYEYHDFGNTGRSFDKYTGETTTPPLGH